MRFGAICLFLIASPLNSHPLPSPFIGKLINDGVKWIGKKAGDAVKNIPSAAAAVAGRTIGNAVSGQNLTKGAVEAGFKQLWNGKNGPVNLHDVGDGNPVGQLVKAATGGGQQYQCDPRITDQWAQHYGYPNAAQYCQAQFAAYNQRQYHVQRQSPQYSQYAGQNYRPQQSYNRLPQYQHTHPGQPQRDYRITQASFSNADLPQVQNRVQQVQLPASQQLHTPPQPQQSTKAELDLGSGLLNSLTRNILKAKGPEG